MSVFGGTGNDDGVHTLDLVTGAWSGAVVTSGPAPGGRNSHSAVGWIDPSTNKPQMSVFGGIDGSLKNDVHTLDLVTGNWSGAVDTSGTPPSARYVHSAVGWIDPNTNNPKMSVFGGSGAGMMVDNDVHTLDLVTGVWSGGGGLPGAVVTSGTPPSARYLHSAVGWIDPSTNNPKMSVFGGYDGSMKNDVHTLDLVTGAWSGAVVMSGTAPSARYYQSAVGWIDPSSNTPKMSVFGGSDDGGGSFKNDVHTLLLHDIAYPISTSTS